MHFTLLRINFLIFALLGGAQLFAQAPMNRLFGTYETETGATGVVLQDSTIYALGTSSAFTEYSSQIYLIKVDKNGDLLWSKFYGGTGVDDAVDMYVDLAVDTSIYIASTSFVGFSKGYDVKLTKVDKAGNFIWEKSYGTTDWDIASKMIKTSTNMFAICGKTYGNSFGSTDGMLLLLDMNGDSIVFQNYGDANENMFHDIMERSADSLVFCGETFTTGGMQRAWIVESNIETGSFKNSYFGNVYNRTFNSIERHPNGNYLVSVTTDSTGVTQTDIFMEVLDKNTHTINLEIPVLEVMDEVAVDARYFNSRFHFLGMTKTYGWGGWEAAAYIFDSVGAYIYSKTYGAVNDDFPSHIMPNNNYAYTIIGTSGGAFGVADLWIVNIDSSYTDIPFLDSQLDINTIHETDISAVNVNVYPNPFNDIVTIQSDDRPKKIIVYNALGKVVSSVTNASTIDLSSLTAGTYFLSVNLSDGNVVRKCLIKAK